MLRGQDRPEADTNPTFAGDLAIGKRFIRPQPADLGKRLRVNDQVRISPIRLIGEDSEQIGVIELDEAKRRARDAGLDLVEVSPNSTPPVCRIMDYGKWKYQQRKKEQKARSNSKTSELREVRLRPKIDTHDLNIKLGKAREFLGDNDKVQFTLLFRGREMAHRDLGYKLMMDVKEQLAEISKVETEPRQQGRRMTMVLSPSKKQGAAKPKPTESTEEPEGSTAGEPANPGLGAGQGLNIPASVVPSTENSD